VAIIAQREIDVPDQLAKGRRLAIIDEKQAQEV
jgi:hypothetical protein